jgi:hypothetical protein
VQVSTNLATLQANTTYHARAVATNAAGTVLGNDIVFTTAPAQTCPAGQSGTPPNCHPPQTANVPPRSRIKRPTKRVAAAKLKQFTGTVSDPDDTVTRVEIALIQVAGGVRAAASKPSCHELDRRGRLVPERTAHGVCRATLFLKASGANTWKFTLKHRLPPGSYVLDSRATDSRGATEASFSSRAGTASPSASPGADRCGRTEP